MQKAHLILIGMILFSAQAGAASFVIAHSRFYQQAVVLKKLGSHQTYSFALCSLTPDQHTLSAEQLNSTHCSSLSNLLLTERSAHRVIHNLTLALENKERFADRVKWLDMVLGPTLVGSPVLLGLKHFQAHPDLKLTKRILGVEAMAAVVGLYLTFKITNDFEKVRSLDSILMSLYKPEQATGPIDVNQQTWPLFLIELRKFLREAEKTAEQVAGDPWGQPAS